MERGEQRRLKQLRLRAAKLGLSVVRVRTLDRARVRFCVRNRKSRGVVAGEHGLTLDELESELLQREKKRLKHM